MNFKNTVFAAVMSFGLAAFAQGKSPENKPDNKGQDKAAEKKAEGKGPDKAAAAAPMAMPTMSPEGKKLIEGMLGNWKANDFTLTMGEKSMKGKMTINCEKAAGGWGTLCKGVADLGKEMPKQEVTFLYGWDLATGEGHMFEVSNMAEVHNHAGKWTDDKSITMDHTGKTFEGKEEKDSLTMTWNSPKEIAIKATGTQGTVTAWTISATAKK
jgi:hypothetical protein